MSTADIEALVTNELRKIAPEVDLTTIDSTANIREELDIDSIDWLNFLVAMEEKLNISIPEADYKQLDTLKHILEYLKKENTKV